jgi:hypothetical protein
MALSASRLLSDAGDRSSTPSRQLRVHSAFELVESRHEAWFHILLLDAHEELRAREAVKHQYIAGEFAKVLVGHDAPVDIATIAGQLAVACYYSGRILTSSPAGLSDATATAFRHVVAIHREPSALS